MASLVLNETGMEDCGIDDSFKYNLYSVVYSVVFVLGLITNCAALFVFCFRMKMRNETTMFMTNLALSDLVFVFTLPFKVFYNVNRHWPFGDGLCKVSGTAFITNIYGSMLFLTCISVDRFLAIVYPFRSRSIRTRRNAAMVCAAVWLTIVGGGISVTFFSTINSTNRATTCFEGFSKSTWRTYLSKITIFIEIVGFLLPLLANLVCSSLVLRTLRRPVSLGHGCDSKKRVLRMILVHLAIFIICFVPYNSILFLYALVRTQALANCSVERFARTLYPITLCLASLNCCLDPVVYYFTSESFQKSLTLGSKGSGSRPESIPRSDSETQDLSNTPPRDTHTLTRNGKDTKVSESQFVFDAKSCSYDSLIRYKLRIDPQCSQVYATWYKKIIIIIIIMNASCQNTGELRMYQHHVYAVVYSVILVPGLLGNILAIWVFRVYIRETKKAVVFMMNLAVADLMQVLSLPLRIYYYLNNSWPFGHALCMICFYLKYVNMYASIYFLVCVSVRRCELIMRPLRYNASRRKADVIICTLGWFLVCLGCLAFPLLRNPEFDDDLVTSGVNTTPPEADMVCFSELPMQMISTSAAWVILIVAELLGFIIPFTLVLACTCLTAGSLQIRTAGAIPDQGEKRRALRMVLSCTAVFLVCFAPYHITMPLDFLAKANTLSSCTLRELILRCHPVTLCLASINCSLDPIMYYFTTDEFWRRLSKLEIPERMISSRWNVSSGLCVNDFLVEGPVADNHLSP
ncbi:uncharacterized protein LOC133485223 [Phyllopteryx taeniolatus]|uniref:uncharacterized protein LOC133485223 n=1 Tax=Phyllopteryx taeniolatus TaxID=161469 RepID=UPI002AD55AFE|nr:uncharacterized protein LOC133485223 [Phyllopteryx taeniolatus]